MKENFEEKFLDYLEGLLSPEEKLSLEAELESDPELKRSFENYKKVISTERLINMQQHELSPNFSVKVMEEIEKQELGFFRRYFMEMSFDAKSAIRVFASLAAIVCVVQLYRITPQNSVQIEGRGAVGSGGNEMSVHTAPQPQSSTGGPVLAKPLEVPKGNSEREALKEIKTAPTITDNLKQAKDDQSLKDLSKDVRQRAAAVEKNNLPPAPAKEMQRLDDQIERLTGAPMLVASPGATKKKAREELNESGFLGLTQPVPMAKGEDSSLAKSYSNPRSQPLDTYRKSLTAREALEAMTYYRRAQADGETYQQYEENVRQEVIKEQSSTFSIDVDTASYTNARRYIKNGALPPQDSVRVEEFLNYFDYDYPQQYEKPFSLSYEIAPSPLEKDRYLLKLGIKAKDKKEESKPWNLVFLVDVSGSMMDQTKLPLVQRSLRLLTENMKEGDKVAIVTYAGSAGTALESTTIKEKSKILSAIDALNAGGSTNGSGGIIAAYDIALKNKIPDAVNRVVLATDGDFNVGITSRDELIKLIEEKRKSGITLTTLGFGAGNINDSSMEQLANKGNGNYYYIDSFQEARKVLETDLAGTMEVVAKDVKLQMEFNPDNIQSYRLIGYENRKLKREDFNNDTVDAGEIGTGHTVTAMYEIVLKDSPLAQKLNEEYRYQNKTEEQSEKKEVSKELSSELGFLKIRFKQPEGSESELLKFPIEKQYIKESDKASKDFNFAAAVSYFGHKLRGSQYAGSYSFKEIAELAENSKGEDKHGYRREFIELVKDAASIK